jgi:hypothetical protein
VDDCAKVPKSRGLCGQHYAADQRKKYGPCTVDDCDNRATSRHGLCAKHYWRKQAHGTTDEPPPRRKQPLICSVEGCSKPTKARGWCGTHWKRWRIHGTTDLVDPPAELYCRGCASWIPRENYDPGNGRCKPCGRKVKRDRDLFRAYRVFRHEVEEQLVKQDHRCAICRVHQDEVNLRLVVDHCHTTLAFRGMLCTNCNQGLGKFKDSPELLEAAAAYLRLSRAPA